MSTISGRARIAGVIGWPVSHSLSPRLHNEWVRRYQIDGAYIPLPVRPEDLGPALTALPRLGFAGVNVTVPHKEAALDFADSADQFAQRVGAANTLIFHEDGTIEAHNTDGFGFIENVRARAPTTDLGAGRSVVLGAGGSARAVVAALIDAGAAEVLVVNRTRERAERLADTLGARIVASDWDDREAALEGAALLVNTTTLGMTGAPPLELSLEALPKAAVVTDLVYNPLETGLLHDARERGLHTVDGIGMLIHQAQPGFRAWFGVEPQIDDALRRFVLDGLAAG